MSEPTAPKPETMLADGAPIPLPPPAQGVPAVAARPPLLKRWTELFGIADALAVVGLLVAAFLVCAFAVRHSDFWQHLAVGRLVAQGGYVFGADPFSYSTEGRTWVNHAWLFDLMVYGAYSVSETFLVCLKAVLVALVLAVLLLQRRTGDPVWLWFGPLALALLALAPRMLVQPLVLSVLLLAVLLTALERLRGGPVWRLPAVCAALCCVWANGDQWFFVGPAVVLLYAVGASIQGATEARAESSGGARALWLAAAASVLACNVGPHHVRVWALPAEAFDATLVGNLSSDPGFGGALLSPLFDAKGFLNGYADGNPVNPLAYVLLLLGGLVALALDYKRAHWGRYLAWAGLAVLSLLHARSVPLFAVVAGPALAVALCGLARNAFGPKTVAALGDGLGVAGRLAALALALALPFAAWPGWLNAAVSSPAVARRVDPRVIADPTVVALAERVREWRESGQLPPEARGVSASVDYAHYCAWFAPKELSFFDTRYALHAPEAEPFLKLRLLLRQMAQYDASRQSRGELLGKFDDLEKQLTGLGAAYLVLDRTEQVTAWPRPLLSTRLKLWAIDGRLVALGRTAAGPVAAALAYDAPAEAFGPKTPRTPVPASIRVGESPGFWERYLAGPPPRAGQSLRAEALREMTAVRAQSATESFADALPGRALLIGGAGWAVPQLFRFTPPTPPDVLALSVLQLRAARSAVAANPDDLGALQSLADAYRQVAAPAEFRDPQILTALRRAMDRLPAPDRASPRQARQAFLLAGDLSATYLEASLFDLALEYHERQVAYLKAGGVAQSLEQYKQLLDSLEGVRWQDRARGDQVEPAELVQRRLTAYENRTAAGATPDERAAAAAQMGLPREAIKVLKDGVASGELERQSKDKAPFAIAGMVGLLIQTGQVEQAARDINDILGEGGEAALAKMPGTLRAAFTDHLFRVAWLTGDHPKALTLFRLLTDDAVPPEAPGVWAGRALIGLDGQHALSRLLSLEQMSRYVSLATREASEQFTLGLIALEGGDNAAALAAFRAAAAPFGTDVNTPVRMVARLYVRGLESQPGR